MNRWLAEDMREDLADLHAAFCATSPSEPFRSRSRLDFLSRLGGDTRRPGFAMVIAETVDLAGCAFGFPVPRDGLWWLGFDGVLPLSVRQLTESGGVFAITHLLVRPHAQELEVASRLQERLLADHHASLGVTLVAHDDHPALDSVRSWGWWDLGEIWRPAGPAAFWVLVLPVGERTPQRLEGLAHHARPRWPG
ncbi:hypothetical protein [Streptomyces sp. NBC_01304]|uniref:hypothetical protein n=1 Tax=Streptomyces sp. NBC_01304 TaxID=2903818 RepID=UPI002E10871A|nr:hypothetical protein OG430_06790 [Streptomyces sp. NBC_01304]